MTDTPLPVQQLQLQLWLQKPPGVRLQQAIADIDDMRKLLRETKQKLGLPLGDLDPVGVYLQEKNKLPKN